MNKLVSSLFSLLGVCFLSCKNPVLIKTNNDNKTLLWEITGNGLLQPSFFLGTMHLMCAEDAKLSENVKKIISNSDTIYLEIDLDNASELLSGMLAMSKNSDKKLLNLLAADEYERVKLFFLNFITETSFEYLSNKPPLLLASSLFEFLLPCNLKNGVEMKIIDEVYSQKKVTKGLETVAFQAAIFDSIPYEEQAKELLKSIDNLQQTKKLMFEMIETYKQQDIDKLFIMSMEEDSSIMNHADIMLFTRNQDWVTQFDAIASKNTTLFAVGAAHLGGEKGVLQLLRKKGYNVRPLVN